MAGEKGQGLSPEQKRRYSRQVMLPGMGEEGQEKLLSARVLLVGAGGLGSSAGLYLGAAGVGTLGIMDGDTVDSSNLHRQVLHSMEDLGRPKPGSARDTISAVNPDVHIIPMRWKLTAENAADIISDYDIVVDCSDNFAARYLMADACYLAGKPMVHGSVYQYEGQASVFAAGGRPCYRCLFSRPPPAEDRRESRAAAVLGPVPGIIGMIQAAETIKLITGAGTTLAGRLLLVDTLGMSFRELNIERDPECPLCGDKPVITRLLDDYQAFVDSAWEQF